MKIPRNVVALIIVCCGSIIGPLGMSAVNVAIPHIATEMQASAAMMGWLPTFYLLGTVIFLIPSGKIADNYGRKKVYAIGLLVNALSALMCGLESAIEWLLFWRFVQGIAGAAIFGVGIAILSSATPSGKQGMALGIASGAIYTGLSIAPIFGGILTEEWSWRAVFYVQVPLSLMLVLTIVLCLPGDWKNSERKPLDWWGTLLFSAFSTFLVFGLSYLPDMSGILLLLIAIITLTGFIFQQSKTSKPLIRLQLFSENRLFSLSLSTSFMMYASNFGLTFLLSLYLQNIRNLSPSDAGEIILLQAVSMAIVAPIAGRLSDKTQPRFISTIGCFIFALGFVVLLQLDAQSSLTVISGALLLLGLGFGLFSPPNNNAILSQVSRDDLGIASSSMNLSRSIGNLFGMSIINLIMHQYIGSQTLSEQNQNALMQVLVTAFTTSLIFVTLACILSGLRGKRNQLQVQTINQ